MIHLSYSSLNDLYNYPHSWLNKMMGIKKPYREYFEGGKRVHNLIQDHFAGVNLDERVAAITDRVFPIVEQEDFDPKCKIEIPLNDKYYLIGYVDGWNPETKAILEIKTSVKPTGLWGVKKYKDSLQRKIYGLAKPEAKESFLIAAVQDVELWGRIPPKTITMKITERDKQEAMEWIQGGLKILEKGDFKSDLENGRCTHYMCPYGENCYFK